MICVKCKRDVPDGPFCAQCGAKQERSPRRGTRRANGTGTAYKQGRSWIGVAAGYSYSEKLEDGSLRTVRVRPKKCGCKTKTEALVWANGYSGNDTPPAPTLIELWNGYSTSEMLKLSKDKIVAYKKARERLEPIIGRRIDTLRIADLQRVVDEKAPSHYTARDMRTVLSKLYQRAMAERRATVNLSQFIVLPELDEKEAEPFTQDEVAKMWDAYNAGDTFVGYLLLLIYTGMMPAELRACKKDMIDREKHEIWGCGKKTTKRKKELPIVYPDFLEPVLTALCAYSAGEMLLGMTKTRMYDEYHKATQRLGIRDLPPYSCRHTYGTEAVKGKNSPEVVRQMLRHASITTQQRYTHLSSEGAHKAANALKH